MAAPRIEKECQVCSSSYQGTKASTRCTTCKREGRKVRTRKCLECTKQFNLIDESHVVCHSCADAFNIDPWEVSPQRAEEIRAEKRKARWQESQSHFREWLDNRDRFPRKGKIAKVEPEELLQNTHSQESLAIALGLA